MTSLRGPRVCIPLLLGTLALACQSTGRTTYVHPGADLGAIRRVAVLPFTAVGQERTAAEKVEQIFVVELLALGVVEVTEPGQVAKLFTTEKLASTDELGPADFQRLGQALAVEGLFLGNVVDFANLTVGTVPAPEITIQLRLVEVASGTTIWSSTETRSGVGAGARLFGMGGDSLTEATRQLLRKQLRRLTR